MRLTSTFILASLFAGLIVVGYLSGPATVQAQGQEGARVISVLGAARVQGQKVFVHITVVVPPGANANQVAAAALKEQGARPLRSDEYSTTGLVWDQFFKDPDDDDFVTQNYNPANDPTGGGETALLNTHSTWTNVTTSRFAFDYGGTTGRCPSLVRECPGRQRFDGNNDVAWLALGGGTTLGVTWYGTSVDEADMALNTNFSWSTDGVNHYDVETVYLHENGHVAGLGHSDVYDAVMYAYYDEVTRGLHLDDIDGISFLYPASSCESDSDCDDGDECTLDTCDAGTCYNTPRDCDDGDACTTDSCDSVTGNCSYDSITCDDGDACTTDSCEPGSGCKYDPVICTDGKTCVNGDCVSQPQCAAKNDPCTTNSDCCSGKCRNDKCRGE